MAHPYHMHREHQVSHRRVQPMLADEVSGATGKSTGKAFSAVTSKSAALTHDDGISGAKGASRYARGGKVKGKGHQTNIAIVMPHHPPAAPPAGPAGPAGGPPPMAGPGLPPPGGPPGMPPPGMPPGMPMRARGGKIDGEATKGNIKAWGKRAAANSYFRGGAATGVGREEKAEHKRKSRK